MENTTPFFTRIRAEYAAMYRDTLTSIGASFSEEFVDDSHAAIIFHIYCQNEKIEVLNEIPLEAYVSVGQYIGAELPKIRTTSSRSSK